MIKRQNLTPYLFLLPALLGLLLFRVYPVFLAFRESLFDVAFVAGQTERFFVGLQNYAFLLDDFVFWTSLRVTLVLSVIINPIQIALALLLAMLLSREIRRIRLFRTIYLLPVGVSLPIASVIWGLMLNPHDGLVNSTLGFIGIPPQPFLTSQQQALWSIVLIASWKGVAFWMLFLLAGLKDIPRTYYDAARIDGASPLKEFTAITFPLMRRPLLFVTVADTTANFLLFVPMYLLTRGGPQLSTNVLVFEAYRSAFVYQDLGRGMALTSILTLIVLVTIGLQFLILRPRT